ncbi:MAG: Rrf2 family transcriptional regulator [Armatimonadota bacterium]
MIHISEAASLALHALALLAHSAPERRTAAELAERLDASEAHLAKVLQRLRRARLVASVRGPHGGFVLARDPSEISLLEVYETIEGPLDDALCTMDKPVCRGEQCLFGGLLCTLTREARAYLSGTKLDQLGTVF